jgi:aspartate aminotransferase
LGLTVAFKEDTSPNKVSLGVGAYRDDNGKPVVLQCVQKAKSLVPSDMEYCGIDGVPEFVKAAQKLVFGDEPILKNGLVASTQTLSGTGALRVCFAFLNAWLPKESTRTVYVPKPTWANHKAIIAQSGLKSADYRYYKAATNGLD